jgi:hypothetical protein
VHQPHPLFSAQSVQVKAVSQVSHEPVSGCQTLHVPLSGPVALPGTQMWLDSHQPQPAVMSQSPHVECEAQRWLVIPIPVQSAVKNCQSAQRPITGPENDPTLHVPLDRQKPQETSLVHSAQSVCAAQFGALLVASIALVLASDPLMVASGEPMPVSGTLMLASGALIDASGELGQVAALPIQPVHEPCVGPMALPDSHRPVVGQKPQPIFCKQSPQAKLARQGSPPA